MGKYAEKVSARLLERGEIRLRNKEPTESDNCRNLDKSEPVIKI